MLADLEGDNREGGPRQHGLLPALTSPQVWLLTAIQFCLTSANPTFGFWGPTIIEGIGVNDNVTIGLLSAVANIVAVISLIVVSRHSDSDARATVPRGVALPGVCHWPGLDRPVCESPRDRLRCVNRRNTGARDSRCVLLAVSANAAGGNRGRRWDCAHQLGRQFLGLGGSLHRRLAEGPDRTDGDGTLRGCRIRSRCGRSHPAILAPSPGTIRSGDSGRRRFLKDSVRFLPCPGGHCVTRIATSVFFCSLPAVDDSSTT